MGTIAELGINLVMINSSNLMLILNFPNYPSFPGLLSRSFYWMIGKSILLALTVSFLGIILFRGATGFELVINSFIYAPVWLKNAALSNYASLSSFSRPIKVVLPEFPSYVLNMFYGMIEERSYEAFNLDVLLCFFLPESDSILIWAIRVSLEWNKWREWVELVLLPTREPLSLPLRVGWS